MSRQTLRPYQQQAINSLRASLATHARVLLVSPTGSGKTTIAAEMMHGARERNRRVLFLAHRKELIDQCSTRLDQFGIDHGVIMASHPRYQPLLPVQVASVQTLARREKPPVDLIVIDEAHHARAGTYQQILDCYPAAKTVGLSATPWRSDGKGLGELFEDVVIAATVKDLTAEGHLVPVTGFAFDVPDLGSVRKKGTDYDEHGLELVMGGTRLMGSIVGQWLAHARGKRTVLFAVNVKHSLELVERFRLAGVAAEHVDGTTPKDERAAILARVASGQTTIVSNVGVLTEGWDLPACEVCILARPTLSVGLYLQMAGRVLRPAPGKPVARIHDHAGCILQHGPPEAERDYSLEADTRKASKTDKVQPLRSCKECFAIYDATLEACPVCGFANPRRARKIEEVDSPDVQAIPIEEIQRRKAEEQAERRDKPALMRAAYTSLRRKAEKSGYKPGWVMYRFKAAFGVMPPRWLAAEYEAAEGRVAS